MPKYSAAQITGDAGENWFVSQLPEAWLLQPPKRDVGVDGVVVICDASDLNGREFRVQIKASQTPTARAGTVVISGIKRTTLEYWFLSPLPTLLVFYDAVAKSGYYAWHYDLFDQVKAVLGGAPARTASLSIPTANTFGDAGWENIRSDIRDYFRTLSASIHAAHNAKFVMPTLHDLASVARQLNSIDHQTVPHAQRTDEQNAILSLWEMMQHRLVVTSLSTLLNHLARKSHGAETVQAWILSYSANVTAVFPTFSELTAWDSAPEHFPIKFSASHATEHRHKFIETILTMIMLLAPGRFNRDT
jgi:hypothetical protein